MENADKKMQEIINGLNGKKPSLLLHSCCAPCSSAVIERIKDHFNLTVFFYNPNMDTLEEFNKRLLEQKRLCEIFDIPVIEIGYQKQEYLDFIKGLESEKEGGKRCFKCFELRINKTAELAKQNGIEYFATTLTVSPLKNAQKLNGIGELVSKNLGVKYLPSDFKKQGGYLRSIELSKKYDLYRQNYCGCEFSKR
jgi:predicted adenine nucleotide alpha hydrolase (AANH) superfamily ATPase